MIEQLVDQIEGRFAELERQMSDPEVIADRERYAEVGREYRELEPAHELAREYVQLRDDLEGAQELLAEDGDDPELRKLVADAPGRLEELGEEIRLAMVERDPNDSKNVLVEIRAGTGGDEAALFAGDLFKMLTRYAEQRGFATEVLSSSPAEVGGFKEVTFAIKGEGAYSVFKFEGGTHRVQRVPKTESQGRIHTSTATVAVLPEAEEVEVEIDPNDLQVDVYRSSGPGRPVGQHDRLRGAHHPRADRDRRLDAGREVAAPEPRQGDAGAARPAYEQKLAEQQAEIASERRSQVGIGRALGEDPHLQLPPGPGHRSPRQASPRTTSTRSSAATCASSPTRSRPRRSASGSRRRPPRPRPDGGRRSPRAGSARPSRRQPTRSPPPASRRRASTPSCCSPRPTGSDRARLAAEPEAGGRRRTPRAASARWCGAGSAASRSPTSSAARAFGGSSSRSTAGP